MSTELYEGDDYALTQYWGGEDNGISLQITDTGCGEPNRYVQLNRKQISKLAKQLDKWLKGTEDEAFLQEL